MKTSTLKFPEQIEIVKHAVHSSHCFERKLPMASKLIVLSITATLLFGAGCSKNRGWLSRNDYSEMQDPFMEPDSAVAKSSGKTSADSGRAALDDSEPAMAEGRARISGPKPIRQTAATNSTTENGRPVSPASYPDEIANDAMAATGAGTAKANGVKSYTGPALSDFLQKKKAAARDAATSVEELPARTVSSAKAAARETMNPAATKAALPTMNPEAESFHNFLSDTKADVANTSRKVKQQGTDTQNEAQDFLSTAEQMKNEWSTSANSARASISAAPTAAREKAETVFDQARQATREMADSMLTPEFDDAGSDVAEPLISRPKTAAGGSTLSRAKAPAQNNFSADENPFADSFEEFHSSGSGVTSASTSQKPTTKPGAKFKSSKSSIDNDFQMDTGWKPANMTRP